MDDLLRADRVPLLTARDCAVTHVLPTKSAHPAYLKDTLPKDSPRSCTTKVTTSMTNGTLIRLKLMKAFR